MLRGKKLSLPVKTNTRILLLTQWFDPEPTFKGLVFARELMKQGFEVEVVTGFPNYPYGRLYPGYKLQWLQREIIDGVHITRVPLYPSHDQSSIRRLMNYVSFAASALIYVLFFAKRPDVMYAYHPPLTIGVVACIANIFRSIPVVYDIQDMWPDTLRATGMLTNARVLSVVENVCGWVYSRVDQIVVLSPGFKKVLEKRGVAGTKISVVYNWADERAILESGEKQIVLAGSSCQFRILFAGNMGKAQSLETVLQAAVLLQQKHSQVCWVMLGGGVEVEKLKREAIRLRLTNVMFLPAVPMRQVGAYLQEADALLVHLRKDPLFEITIPSKTQAYMAVGKPLVMAVNGDAADLVRAAGGGVVVESQNPQALAKAAEELANSSKVTLTTMGRQAKQYYQRQLSLAVGIKRFGEIFKGVVENSR